MINRDLFEKLTINSIGNNKTDPKASQDKDLNLISNFKNLVKFQALKAKRNEIISWELLRVFIKDTIENTVNEDEVALQSSRISYETFKRISEEAPERCKKYFSPSNFIRFPKYNHQIEKNDLIRFLERSVEIERCIVDLMEYVDGDSVVTAAITEQQLEAYLFILIPQIDIMHRMHNSFHEFYMYTASQKFFFFCDPHRHNSISLKKLAHSTVMQELQHLLRAARKAREDNDNSDFSYATANSWFSGNNALRIYSYFLELDKDQNGMLSIEEMRNFSGLPSTDPESSSSIQFTETAIRRLFDEYVIFQPSEMDYKGFVNLILAINNMATHKEAIGYFWRVLDMDRSGRLTVETIKYFYRDVKYCLKNIGYDAPNEDYVVVEIFDLLACNDGQGATFADMVNSKQGHTVITMLLDVNGFWRYDNRESILAGGGGGGGQSAHPDE
eukprot:gene31956-41453_t